MTGRALDALDEAVARTLGVLRVFAVLLEVLVVTVWHSWYFSGAQFVVPAVAAVWGLLFAAACLRNRLNRPAVAVDFLVALLLAATAAQSLDPAAVERGPNWLLFRLVGTSIAIAWTAPAAVWLAATGALAVAAGTSYASAGLPRDYTVSAVVVVVVGSVLLTAASRLPRRGAVEADAALARVGARRQVQEVTAIRQRDLRERERVVHDTVLNTLTGLGWATASSSPELVRSRCRQSVAVCTDFLSGDADGTGEVGRGSDEVGVGASLAQRLAAAAAQARRDGLRVDVSTSGEADVPSDVGVALAAAVGEALSNVRRHAGTGRAWLEVRANGGVMVTVRDHGVGFEGAAVRPDRLGLRNSIMERVAEAGGEVDVQTTPGRGTTVVLQWSPPPVTASAVVTETALLEAAYRRDAVRTVGVAALTWQCLVGLLLVTNLARYDRPYAVVGAWALTVVALGWHVVSSLEPGLEPGHGNRDEAGSSARYNRSTWSVGAVVGTVVGAQVAAATSARQSDLTLLSWLLAVAGGVVCVLAVSRPARVWVPASALTIGTALVVVVLRYDATLSVVTRVTGPLYLLAGILVASAMFGRSRQATIAVTARAAQAEVDLAAERVAALVVRRDREQRLRQLADGPLPLLADVGAGRLDPSDPVVRRACAARASALRRTLSHDHAPKTLLSALEPTILALEQRGALIEVQVGGDLGGLAGDVVARVADATSRVLSRVATGPVLVTLLGDGTSGSLIVSFPAGRPPRADGIGTGGLDSATDVGSAADINPVTDMNFVMDTDAVTDVNSETDLDIAADVEDGQMCVEIGWNARRPGSVRL